MRSVPLPFLSKITLLWTRAREPGPVSPVKVDSPLPFPWTQRGEIYSFSISIMSVLVGISAINDILTSLAEADQEIPIFNTMQNTGISLALSIYLFSIANCLVVTNYWIITKRRDMAIRKAFGWSNYNLICAVVSEMAEILLVSLCIGFLLIEVFSRMTEGIISIHITPFFLCGTLLLLLFTLVISVIIPVIRILKIHPAEVIS